MTEMFNFTQRHVTESLPRGGMKRRNSIGWECGLGFLGPDKCDNDDYATYLIACSKGLHSQPPHIYAAMDWHVCVLRSR